MTADLHPATPHPASKLAPRYVVAAAWAVPILTAADFFAGDVGWYAAVPVAVLAYAALRERSVRALRWWIGAMAVLFALPFFGSMSLDSSQGIMHDMHPLNLALFVVAALVVLAKLYRSHRA